MLRISPAVLLLLALPLADAVRVQADPVAELAAFSVFPNANAAELLKGDAKAARGPAMSVARDLSVQSCYVVSGAPAQALAALRAWDASKHREMKIYLHADLPAAPAAANFAGLRSAPGNGAVRTLAGATAKLSPALQISQAEAGKPPAAGGGAGGLPDGIAAFWADVLTARAKAFVHGGVAAQPSYDHTGQDVSPGRELSGLLGQQEKIRGQFASFLRDSGISGGSGSLKPELYYELIDVEDEGVLTLGAFVSKPVGAGFQAAEVSYYASGGYYASLTLYQMWPVDVGGKPATLVWRGDLISSASLAALHGMERLGSESAMMKDVSRAVTFLKRDTAAGQ